MQIKRLPTSTLVPASSNPRRITPEAVDAVADSIRRYGWRQPIVVDENNVVIAGHVRLQAAKKLEHETVPVHIAADLTPQQVDLLRVVDNRSAEESSWDVDLLAKELARLSDEGGEEALESAWSPEELSALLKTDTPDNPPEKRADITDDNQDYWGDGAETRPNTVMLCFEVPADRASEYRNAIDACIAELDAE